MLQSRLITTLFWAIAALSFFLRWVRKANEKRQHEQNHPPQQQRAQTAANKPQAVATRPLGERTPTRLISVTGSPNPTQGYAPQWFDHLVTSIESRKPSVPSQPAVEPVRLNALPASGSMNYQSTEGECDTHPEHNRPLTPYTVRAELPGLSLRLDPQSLLHSVVFAEVLGKPVSTRRRRAYSG
ncbi:MAG: hypothetical protein LBS11_03375 [Oscillospiraceae bacterium]|jgi:hypothetical protein|nr:hypothetical protein [Oscillospiraceae bacterium]